MNLDRSVQARGYYDRAAAAFEAMQWHTARLQLHQAIRLNPDDPAARLLDARLHLQNNHAQDALAALDVHTQLDPQGADDPAVMLLRSEALVAAGLDDEAKKNLRKLTVLLPDDARPHRLLAGLYLKAEEHDDAVAALQTAVALSPNEQASRRLLSRLLETSQPKLATQIGMQSMDTHTDTPELLRRARLCRQTDRLRDAADLYTVLLERESSDAGLWIEAADLDDELGFAELAEQRLTHVLSLGTHKQDEARETLALVHMHAGRFAQAAMIWWKLARSASDPVRAWSGLWVCACCCGRSKLMKIVRTRMETIASAIDRCTAIAVLWPHAAAGRLAALDETGSPLYELVRSGSRTLDRAREAHPKRADMHYHRGVLELALGNVHAAATSAEAALAINPNYAAAARLSGMLKRRAG